MGGNGGCGEFDIVEAVIGNAYEDMLFTTVYDFKGTGSPGTNKYFRRPTVSLHGASRGPLIPLYVNKHACIDEVFAAPGVELFAYMHSVCKRPHLA